MKQKLYRITWRDHTSFADWKNLTEICQFVGSLKPNTTVGEIVLDQPDYIVICGSRDGFGNFAEGTLIYKGDIISKKRL